MKTQSRSKVHGNKEEEDGSNFLMWLVGICFILFFIYAIGSLFYTENKHKKIGVCLEPLAKEICEQNNLYYNYNNHLVVYCSEDRKEDVEFKFYEEEKEGCGR